MGNLTGQIMKELQAQGKSEDWTVGFAKMANALYLKVVFLKFSSHAFSPSLSPRPSSFSSFPLVLWPILPSSSSHPYPFPFSPSNVIIAWWRTEFCSKIRVFGFSYCCILQSYTFVLSSRHFLSLPCSVARLCSHLTRTKIWTDFCCSRKLGKWFTRTTRFTSWIWFCITSMIRCSSAPPVEDWSTWKPSLGCWRPSTFRTERCRIYRHVRRRTWDRADGTVLQFPVFSAISRH